MSEDIVFNMKPLCLFIKLSRKLRLRRISRYLTFLFVPGGKKFVSVTSLSTISKDPNNSCLCNNVIEPIYDLQIILPVYNVEKYIEECMDSIISQKSNYSFVVTVVNDGSPDKSRTLLKKYESISNVEIIDQENKGFSGARNTALNHIKGKYIMFVDSDDKLADGAIEALMDKASKWNADIVQGGYHEFYGDGKVFKTTRFDNKQNLQGLTGYPWGKVIKSTLMEHIHFPEGYWFEDTVLFFILFDLASNMASVSDIVYCYRHNDKGITATCSGKPKSLDSYYITKRLLQDRELLGLANSQLMYERFLSQVRTNFNRTLNFSDDISYIFFEENVRLKKEYFKGLGCINGKNKTLSKSLDLCNYALYLRALL